MKSRKQYSTKVTVLQILILIGIIANLIIWGWVIYQEATKPATTTVPMANQLIEWDGAGYNGIYGNQG